MKRYIYILALASFAACDYNGRNFPGLDEMSRPENVINGELAITEAELPAVIAALNASGVDGAAAWAAVLNRDKVFSHEAPAASIVPWYLKKLYYGADTGSSMNVTYERLVESDGVEELAMEEVFEDYPAAGENIDKNGWSQYREAGANFWISKNFEGNRYAQFYGAPGKNIVWLISPEIDLAEIAEPKLSFDVKAGNYSADCLEVKIGTDYDGGDPTAATWTDATQSFALPDYPAIGYGDVMECAGMHDLSAVAGQKIRVAFRYNGDGDASPPRTTTYQVDNVKVGKLVPPPTGETESATDRFALSDAGWMFDPTFVKTLATEDYQVLVDYVLRTHAPSNPALVHANNNAEYYYGFVPFYDNVTYREADRSKDTTYPREGTPAEKGAFMNARTIEGLEIFLAETMPGLQPEVNGVEQLAKLTVLIYSDPLSDRQNVVWTYTLRCTAPGKWEFVERQSDDGTVETTP